ncbi:MAG: methyltransferase domain-containing protein [Defluviitaleaceae bacterium]|nr:methyltransferase domain-containing protein [Defluviitaleaceae bacterium]
MLYSRFAEVYDVLMAETPYEKWAAFIGREIIKLNPRRKRKGITVVDLACGTGGVTLPLSRMGFDMVGVDSSAEMLSHACAKAAKSWRQALFLQQDIRRLDLYGTARAFTCACDGLNYIIGEDALGGVFKRVSLFTEPGGLFVFDVNTLYKFEKINAGNTFADTVGGVSYKWKNNYDPKTRLNEYEVEFAVCAGDGTWDRFYETHYQMAYASETIKTLLMEAGYGTIIERDSYSDNPPGNACERITFVAVKNNA